MAFTHILQRTEGIFFSVVWFQWKLYCLSLEELPLLFVVYFSSMRFISWDVSLSIPSYPVWCETWVSVLTCPMFKSSLHGVWAGVRGAESNGPVAYFWRGLNGGLAGPGDHWQRSWRLVLAFPSYCVRTSRGPRMVSSCSGEFHDFTVPFSSCPNLMAKLVFDAKWNPLPLLPILCGYQCHLHPCMETVSPRLCPLSDDVIPG